MSRSYQGIGENATLVPDSATACRRVGTAPWRSQLGQVIPARCLRCGFSTRGASWKPATSRRPGTCLRIVPTTLFLPIPEAAQIYSHRGPLRPTENWQPTIPWVGPACCRALFPTLQPPRLDHKSLCPSSRRKALCPLRCTLRTDGNRSLALSSRKRRNGNRAYATGWTESPSAVGSAGLPWGRQAASSVP
jgi:hypothetical protein